MTLYSLAFLTQKRVEWLSYNGDHARLGRRQFRINHPQFKFTAFPRDATAPRVPRLDGNGNQVMDERGNLQWIYPGFPLEADYIEAGGVP